MSARAGAVIFAIAIVVACEPTADTIGPGPSASSSATSTLGVPTPSAATTPTAEASRAPGGEIRIPLEAGVFAANADSEALIVTRRLIDGKTTRVEAIDLKSRAVSAVRETVDATVTVPSIRDGVVTLLETAETDVPMTYRIRVIAGRWRDASSFKVLDELSLAIAGGDSWNPYPDPQTNGFEIAWMHATPERVYELRIRDADGGVKTAYSSKTPFTFALARSGDVAIGDLGLPGPTAPLALRLYTQGTVGTLVERPSGEGGYVGWQSGSLIWPNGLGLVRNLTTIERIVPATRERATIAVPAGCGYAGVTDAQIAYACGDHVELTGGPGPARLGPPFPLLHARGIVRTEQGPPPIAYVTPVVTDDPRPGAGAKF